MSAIISPLPPPSILRLKDLLQRIRLSRSTIYVKIAAGEFPPPIALGLRAVGWLESDIQKWIESRVLKEVRPSRGSLSSRCACHVEGESVKTNLNLPIGDRYESR